MKKMGLETVRKKLIESLADEMWRTGEEMWNSRDGIGEGCGENNGGAGKKLEGWGRMGAEREMRA